MRRTIKPIYGSITRDVRLCGPVGDVTYHAGYPCHRVSKDGEYITLRFQGAHEVTTDREAFEPHPAYVALES